MGKRERFLTPTTRSPNTFDIPGTRYCLSHSFSLVQDATGGNSAECTPQLRHPVKPRNRRRRGAFRNFLSASCGLLPSQRSSCSRFGRCWAQFYGVLSFLRPSPSTARKPNKSFRASRSPRKITKCTSSPTVSRFDWMAQPSGGCIPPSFRRWHPELMKTSERDRQ